MQTGSVRLQCYHIHMKHKRMDHVHGEKLPGRTTAAESRLSDVSIFISLPTSTMPIPAGAL